MRVSIESCQQLVFGSGVVQSLGDLVRRMGRSRVFIITDSVIAAVGLLDTVKSSLEEAGVVCREFTGSCAEPAVEIASQAVEQARSLRGDAVLGLGGGSNMDLAKMVAILLAHGGSPSDYFSYDNVPGPVLPLICVPTTAGTGSEVSHAAVLTDTANRIKVSSLSRFLRPVLAVVDPQMTRTCPPNVTAESGIDALTHAVEALTARDSADMQIPSGQWAPYYGSSPLTDAPAEKAIELIGRYLPSAVHNGDDMQARHAMAMAATLAGIAFSNAGVALVHALEYPIGGVLHCSHGAGNGLLLPYVMRYNLPARPDAMAKIARLLGADVANLDDAQAAPLAIERVEALRSEIGIPARLRDLGAEESQLAGFAEKAFAIKRLMHTNPRTPTPEELHDLLLQAL